MSAASRHGAATEVAEEIGKQLRESLQERDERDSVVVDVRPAERVDSVEEYDAVVLGSAVYAGRGLEAARDLASEHAEALAERPTWLFSVGPVGEPPKPEGEPVDVAPILKSTKARDHHIFAGKLDRSALLISGLGQHHDCGGGIICGIRLRRRLTYAFSVEPPDGRIEDRGERNPRQVGEEQHGSQTA